MTHIRPVSEQDIATCVAFGLEAFRPVFASYHQEYGNDLFARIRPDWEQAQASLIETTCSDDNITTWVAEVAGRVAGLVAYSANEGTGLGDLSLIAVDPTQQRQGIGAALLRLALDQMKQAGMAYATAYTRGHPGHLPVRQALGGCGFSAMGIQPFTMISKLGEASSPAPSPGEQSHIRPIAPGEAADCVRFGIEAFRPVFASFENLYGKDLFDRLRPDWENAQSAYIASVCTDKATLVSETDGELSGFVVVEPDVFDRIGAIELLAVDPKSDSRGLGTTLNRAALDWLHRAGMDYAIVSTADDPSHAPARRSYEKVGFAPTPVQWNLMAASLS